MGGRDVTNYHDAVWWYEEYICDDNTDSNTTSNIKNNIGVTWIFGNICIIGYTAIKYIL